MEYRRLGKTGLRVSAVCLGGHWKGVGVMMNGPFRGTGYDDCDFENLNNPEFLSHRDAVLSRAIEAGINYVDACSPQEVLAYSRLLKGRRNSMYFGYSWHTREPRYPEWRTGKRLLDGLNSGLREAGLDYVDLWRISLPMDGIADPAERNCVEEAVIEGLARAKQEGKARFTGVSSHDRLWLKSVVARYPAQIEVVLFPYTGHSKPLPEDSLFETIAQNDTGVFAIKPFAGSSLFRGDSSPGNPHARGDDRRARLVLRSILANRAVAAALPGLVSAHQVDNAVRAVEEPRYFDTAERAELENSGSETWSRLPDHQQWLKRWKDV